MATTQIGATRLQRWAWAVAGLALLVGGAAPMFVQPLLHDTAWIVHVVQAMADGQRLYRDLYCINPPQHFLLSLPAAYLARATGLHGAPCFLATTLALTTLSLLLCVRLTRLLLPGDSAFRPMLLFLLALCFVPLMEQNLGHRDPTLFVLFVPYILLSACRAEHRSVPTRLALLAGLLAGLGVAIKPFFVLPWFAVVLQRLCSAEEDRPRWARVLTGENLALTGYLLLYLGLVLTFFSGYVEVLARAVRYYGAYQVPFKKILFMPTTQASLWLLLPSCLFIPHLRRPLRTLAIVLLLVLGGFWAEVLIQHKGWPYHLLPVKGTNILLGATLLWGLVQRWPAVGKAARVPLLLAGLALAGSYATMGLWQTAQLQANRLPLARVWENPLSRLIERHAAGDAVASFSTEVSETWPLVLYQDVRWPSRFFHHWILPGQYSPSPTDDAAAAGGRRVHHLRTEMSAAERFLFDAVIHDLLADPPKLLLVANDLWNLPKGFDYISYFSQDPRFSRLFSRYHRLTRVANVVVYIRDPMFGGGR